MERPLAVAATVVLQVARHPAIWVMLVEGQVIHLPVTEQAVAVAPVRLVVTEHPSAAGKVAMEHQAAYPALLNIMVVVVVAVSFLQARVIVAVKVAAETVPDTIRQYQPLPE
jgi:hypothetical protein